ncbi:MAG: CDP-diacylglycerol--serine O-phosphatidyltransferase [bacterium]|nr:CDP-diacylglycerol--serine O-phosphatidyltransferase [bacterium]
MKKIYLLPNLFTLGNIFFGFFSIVSAIDGEYTRAAYVIIVAAFFDVFDGKIARATNSTSRFGVEFDSLADLVSFGVAPGILAYLWILKPLGRFGWLGAFLFLVCGALRLARFNVQTETISSERFIGLPIPAAAGMLVSTVLFFEHYADIVGPKEQYRFMVAVLVYLLGILMVSNVRYLSLKTLTLRGKSPFKVMVLASLILIIIALKPEIAFFIIGVVYMLFGLLEAIPGFTKLITPLRKKPKSEKPEQRGKIDS